MEYLIEPQNYALDIVQIGCIDPACDDLGPTGHCSPDC